MILTYLSFAAITGGVIYAANKATGVNLAYTLASSVFWPAWWARYMLMEEA